MGADVPCLIILLLPSSKTMPTANLAENWRPAETSTCNKTSMSGDGWPEFGQAVAYRPWWVAPHDANEHSLEVTNRDGPDQPGLACIFRRGNMLFRLPFLP